MPANRYNNLSATAYWWLMTVLVATDRVVIFQRLVHEQWSGPSSSTAPDRAQYRRCTTPLGEAGVFGRQTGASA
jgi:hypothetical protein